MSRLLRADFARLWQSKIFWIGMIYSFGMGLLLTMDRYCDMREIPGYTPSIDRIVFYNAIFMPVVAAAFIGLFIGTEYSDGTIRNKIIVGRTRPALYFSNFIVCASALIIMHLTAIIAIIGFGALLVGNIQNSITSLLSLGVISMVTVVALCAIFLLLSMLIHSRSNAAVAAIFLSLGFIIAANHIESRLNAPEYWGTGEYTYTDENGDSQHYTGLEKNPKYLEGGKRKVFEFLYDFLPECQMFQIMRQNLKNPERLLLYSIVIIVVTNTCGIYFFCRKNLK